MRYVFLTVIALTLAIAGQAQAPKKQLPALRTESKPKIDGLLDDPVWQETVAGDEFVMLEPGNGESIPAGFETYVRFAYDDDAMYISMEMHDPSPDSILKQLTARDDFNGNADFVYFQINPYNDGLNDFSFVVTAAGVQADMRALSDGDDDFGWFTVWKSAVKITEQGWNVELAIPYNCIRFSENGPETWGFNCSRLIRRYRHEYSWNFIDRNINNWRIQAGELTGMKDIEPPLRLSFQPYASGYVNATEGESATNFNAGMDLKYGINESFTLDMSLIPDFGQVAFDEQQLNLGAVENRFDENRAFFIEGTDLFNIGNIFYSRRIGGSPKNITQNSLDDSTLTNATQDYTKLLNATKLTGRTKGNLGIGVLNAITDNSYFNATNSETGEEVKILVEPLTNYNMLVLDQRFNQNASLSLANTNAMREGPYRDANVTALQTDLQDKSSSYKFRGIARLSNVWEGDSIKAGFQSWARFERIKGRFRYQIEQETTTRRFDMNDMGFNARTNQFNWASQISYQNIQPTEKFNRYRFEMEARYHQLYEPRVFERFHVTLDAFANTKNFNAMGYFAEIRPVEHNDYLETRSDFEHYFARPSSFWHEAWVSSDYRKPFALDFSYGQWWWSDYGSNGYYFRLSPRFRFSDKLNMIWETRWGLRENHIGWVDTVEDTIYFGSPDFPEIINSLRLNYVFNPNMSLSIRGRHFWNAVEYDQFYVLNDDGDLDPIDDYEVNEDINFLTWNLDCRFSWWYAPGSEMVLLYRNSLIDFQNQVIPDYGENLDQTFAQPLLHNFSIRIMYFLDYNYLRKQNRQVGS